MSKLDLRLYLILTLLESALLGIPILQARSLSAGGYSLPRLILLLAWVTVFAVCIWLSISVFRQTEVSQKLRLFAQSKWFLLRDWLVVFNVLCWGGIAIFFLQRDFLTFILNSLPRLFEQYFRAILIIGIWSIQSLVALWIIKPGAHNENAIFPAAVQVFLAAFFLYTYTAVNLRVVPYSTTAYFPELAQSFLSGRVDLLEPPATKDLTLFNGKYYVSFPPLGALLMMPLVALRGTQEFNIALFNIFFAAFGVTCMFLALEAMRARGLSQLSWREHAALALFLGFGTAQYSMVLRGLVNFTSQILATAFLALALCFVMSLRRSLPINALLTGGALGLAMLARPNVVFIWIAFAALQMQFLYDNENFSIKYFLQWCALSLTPVFAAVAWLFWYNYVRFGSLFDFGYEHMLIAKVLTNDLVQYGQFHPHFILENLRDNFFRLPYWDENCRMWTFSPQGMSILLASPLIVCAFSTFKKKIWLAGAWLSIGIIALLHALYYNSGAIQVSYRFSLDFMPVIVMLLAFAFKKRISMTALFLIAFSVLVNYFGVLWTLHRLCENF